MVKNKTTHSNSLDLLLLTVAMCTSTVAVCAQTLFCNCARNVLAFLHKLLVDLCLASLIVGLRTEQGPMGFKWFSQRLIYCHEIATLHTEVTTTVVQGWLDGGSSSGGLGIVGCCTLYYNYWRYISPYVVAMVPSLIRDPSPRVSLRRLQVQPPLLKLS